MLAERRSGKAIDGALKRHAKLKEVRRRARSTEPESIPTLPLFLLCQYWSIAAAFSQPPSSWADTYEQDMSDPEKREAASSISSSCGVKAHRERRGEVAIHGFQGIEAAVCHAVGRRVLLGGIMSSSGLVRGDKGKRS